MKLICVVSNIPRAQEGNKTSLKTEAKSVCYEESKFNSANLKPHGGVFSGKENNKIFPMLPGKALKMYMNNGITEYEQSEILDYKSIYFIGNKSDKIEGSSEKPLNDGYDDERGDYKTIMKDHISYRYEIISNLGQGSFGKVFKAFDHKDKKMIAIKIIRNKKKFEFQANVEIKIL